MKYYPISLKLKKPDQLISELHKKGIKVVYDVRRIITPRNSARSYLETNFSQLLHDNGIKYIRVRELGNTKYVTKADDYLTPERKEILNKLNQSRGTGFICYCTEEAQQKGECHASWICAYFETNVSKDERD